MTDINSMPGIQPTQLSEDSKIQFRCGKDLPCFTRCCRGIDIVLTPYDVLRMKKRLDLGSEEFLAIYTHVELLEKTDLPVPVLKMLDDEEKSCPFVRDDGCLIYEDRPSSCRYYPIGHATLRPKEAEATETFYFLVREPHCKGFEKDDEWTVKEWREHEGVVKYDEMNAGWSELMVRKRSFPPNIKLTQDAKKLFFMASYNLDQFRRFVFESSFLTLNKVDEETIEKIKNDEVALMRFGHEWLKGVLFVQGAQKLDDQRMEKWKAEREK